MAVVGDEIWVEFAGGIRSSLHPAKIGEDELSDGHNVITRDGTVRIDQRYILAAEYQSADQVPQGSGYGAFEDCEQYVAVLDNEMVLVDLTTAPLAFTPVIGATGLADGDWLWEQFESYLYAANLTAGLGRKKICAGTDGTGDWSLLARPTKPAAAPTAALYTPVYSAMDFTGSTITDSGANVSASVVGSQLRITTIAAGEHTVDVELDTSPDLRFDAEYRDIVEFRIIRSVTTLEIPKITILEGTTAYDLMFWYGFDGGRAPDSATGYFRLHHIPRSGRDQITKIRFTINAPSGTNVWTITPPKFYGVWLSLPTSYNPGSGDPALEPLKYAYTYFNSTTGLESEPSDKITLSPSQQQLLGEWRNVGVVASAESGVDKIRIHRVIGDDGNETYYQLTEISNSTTTHVDKLPVDEVELLDTFNPGILAGTGITAIATWQGRLCLGVGNLVEISRSDDELAFVSLGGSVDEFDPGNALTFFCDDRKSETVIGLASGDALTVITDRSVRALFGTTPQNWRYVKLPCSEGAVGNRAWCNFREGAIILTPSGRLLYVALGLAEPFDIGSKVRDRIGNEGLKALATADAVVALRPDGQVEVRNQTGAYYIFDLNFTVRKGTHTHPTHSALFVSGLPIRWIGTNGKLYEGGNDDYVTDGGTSGDTGEEVEGWVETRQWSVPRCNVENVFWGDAPDHLRQDNTVIAPRFTLYTSRRTKERLKLKGKDTTPCSVHDSGTEIRARITIDRHTPVSDFRIRMNPLARKDQG